MLSSHVSVFVAFALQTVVMSVFVVPSAASVLNGLAVLSAASVLNALAVLSAASVLNALVVLSAASVLNALVVLFAASVLNALVVLFVFFAIASASFFSFVIVSSIESSLIIHILCYLSSIR